MSSLTTVSRIAAPTNVAMRATTTASPPQSPEDLLNRIGSTLSAERDHGIFFEGDPAEHYYKIVSGTVRLVRMLSDGRRHILDFLHAGQFFGFAYDGEYQMTAEAVTPVTLVRYQRRQIDDLVATRPSLAKFILDLASDELRIAQEQMVVLGRRTAKERVAFFLLETARRATPAENNRAHLSMGRRDIADYLGLTIETVCRVFGQLKQTGLIQLPTTDDVVFLKPRALAELTH
jgi:CRP/FNR family transcriptional regulator